MPGLGVVMRLVCHLVFLQSGELSGGLNQKSLQSAGAKIRTNAFQLSFYFFLNLLPAPDRVAPKSNPGGPLKLIFFSEKVDFSYVSGGNNKPKFRALLQRLRKSQYELLELNNHRCAR